MKKILSVILILALMIPFLGSYASAEGEFVPSQGADVLKAYYANGKAANYDKTPDDTMAIDTIVKKNSVFQSYVHLGATWQGGNEPYLSLGILSKRSGMDNTAATYQITYVKVEMELDGFEIRWGDDTVDMYRLSNGNHFSGTGNWFSVGDAGNFVEMGIPLNVARIYGDANGDLYAKLKVSVSLENGSTEVFDGCVVFDDKVVEYSNTLAGEQKKDRIISQGDAHTCCNFQNYTFDTNDGILIEKFNLTDAASGGHQFYTIYDTNGNPIYEDEKAGSLSFDFYMAPVPEGTPKHSEVSDKSGGSGTLQTNNENGVRALIYIGVGSGLLDGWRAGSNLMLVFSVYNTSEGLVLYYDDGETYGQNPINLGQSCGSFFKLGFDWTPTADGYAFEIAVNGTRVGSIDVPTEKTFLLPLWKGNGVSLGVGVDKTTNQSGAKEVWYRNINMATEIDAPMDDLLDKYGFMSDLELQAKSVGNSYSLRFLTKIQDLNYREVGFEITVKDLDTGANSQTVTYTSDTAYTSVVANGETVEAGEGNYYVGAVVTGIPQSGNYSFEIRTYVVTADGTTLYGELASVQIPDAVA